MSAAVSKQKLKTYASSGCLPCARAFESVTPEQRRRANYGTTAVSTNAWTTSQENKYVDTEHCRSENYMDIHDMGKRTTKYMEFQQSRAPLPNRTYCTHTRAFFPMPLGDAEANRCLAESFKLGSTPNLDAFFDGKSAYEEEFLHMTPAQYSQAKRRTTRPPKELTNTLGGSGALLETRSHAAMNFGTPNVDLAKTSAVEQPSQALYMGGRTRGVNLVSMNTDMERRRRRSASAPGPRPGLAATTQGLRLHESTHLCNDDLLRVRRACCYDVGR